MEAQEESPVIEGARMQRAFGRGWGDLVDPVRGSSEGTLEEAEGFGLERPAHNCSDSTWNLSA